LSLYLAVIRCGCRSAAAAKRGVRFGAYLADCSPLNERPLSAQQETTDACSSRPRTPPRYNELVDHRQARHIGDIIRERDDIFPGRTQTVPNRGAEDQTTRAAAANPIRRFQRLLRLLLGGVVNVLAAIGWFVTLPFITHDDRAATSREQSRG
jgi:hypothetical protein